VINLVGEAPGGHVDITHRPSLALTGTSGRRLCALAGWDWLAYLRHTHRTNLFTTPQDAAWDAGEARARARRIGAKLYRRGASPTVLLGAKVAAAFGLTQVPTYEWVEYWPAGGTGPGMRVALVPHPSGRNRLWNVESERDRARAFLRDLVPG